MGKQVVHLPAPAAARVKSIIVHVEQVVPALLLLVRAAMPDEVSLRGRVVPNLNPLPI